MKIIQLIGSKNKADFAIYLAHTIANFEKRVLVVDATVNENYRLGYTRLEDDEHLYDFQNIEILTGARSWKDVISLLESVGEQSLNYDCIIVDIDSVDTLIGDWPLFAETLYISDNDRINIQKDITLLHRWLDENENGQPRRIHFDSAHKVPEGLIQLLMNHRIEFSPFSEKLDYDDLESRLQLFMQHEQIIPYKKLSRTYRGVLRELAFEWFEIDDSKKGLKAKLFGSHKREKEVLEG